MEYYLHDQRLLEYDQKGTGLPLIFLHGMGGGIRQVLDTCGPLPGVRLLIPHLQGHGASQADWDNLSFASMAGDVLALLDHLQIPSAVFAGISMGAATCLNLAASQPERVKALLLIRNAWTDQPMPSKNIRAYHALGLALKKGDRESFLSSPAWKEILQEHSPYTQNAFLAPFTSAQAPTSWQKYLLLPQQSAIPQDAYQRLQPLAAKTHILACRGDMCHPFSYGEYLQECLPGAHFTEIPNKDVDPRLHRQMIRQALWQILYEEE